MRSHIKESRHSREWLKIYLRFYPHLSGKSSRILREGEFNISTGHEKMEQHNSLFYKKLEEYYTNSMNRKPWNYIEMKDVAENIVLAKQSSTKKSRRQYHLLSLYDVVEAGNEHAVIKKRKSEEDKIIYVTPYEDLFKVLLNTHISVGHGCRDKMTFALKTQYQIPRAAVEKFIETCETCQKKKNCKQPIFAVKPSLSYSVSSHGQVHLVDFRTCPDGEYRWLLDYQDQTTKFTCLRPLKSQEVPEVALELLKIFLEIGPPAKLLSNDKELFRCVITDLADKWPDVSVVYGGPPQRLSLECSQDAGNMLKEWMQDNCTTNWSIGCFFVQFKKNFLYNRVIGYSPYKALFGTEQKADSHCTSVSQNGIKIEHSLNDVALLATQNLNSELIVDNENNIKQEIVMLEHDTSELFDDENTEIFVNIHNGKELIETSDNHKE